MVLAQMILKGFYLSLVFLFQFPQFLYICHVQNKYKTNLNCTSVCTRILLLLECGPALYKFWHKWIIIVNYLKSWDVGSSKLNFWQISISKSLGTENIMSVIPTVLADLYLVHTNKELPYDFYCRSISQCFPPTGSKFKILCCQD